MPNVPWPNPNVALPGGAGSPQPYSDYGVALQPPWLQKPYGEAWASAVQLMCDTLVESMILAVKCRFLTTCPVDALPWIGQERNLDQLPSESLAAYRARLLNAWAAWMTAGTRLGVYNAVTILGYTNVVIRENIDWGVPPSPGYSAGQEWWRFWVVIDQPHPFAAPWFVGDGTIVGSANAVGLTAPPGALQAIHSQIAKWKPAHARLVNVIVIMSGKTVGSTWAVGDGTLVGGKALYA